MSGVRRCYYCLLRRLTAGFLLFSLALLSACNDGSDDDETVLELDPEKGGVFDADAYSAAAAADSLSGVWLLLANYDYQVEDGAVRGAGRELARASVRIVDGSPLTFSSCYTGTAPQTPLRLADGSFQVEIAGAVVQLAPNAANNRLSGSLVSGAGSIAFQGSITLLKLHPDSNAGLGNLRLTSTSLDEEQTLDADCFYQSEQELADRTGSNNPNEIVIRLSRSNQQLLDFYAEGSRADHQLRVTALQGGGRDVSLEFITPARAIGVNKASAAEIAIDSSDTSGVQASLGAAEGDQQASVVVEIVLP